MDVADAARRWADVIRVAWPAGDLDACLALYAEDAVYRAPFGEIEPAHEHIRNVLALGEPGPEVWFGDPVVADSRAAVPWWAVIVIDGEATTFVATDWLRFDDRGLVVEEHADWMSKAGRVEPWDGWGS